MMLKRKDGDIPGNREDTIKNMLGLLTPLLAVFFSILVGGVVIAMVGVNPIYAYHHLWYGAFGTVNNLSETLVKTTPMLIAGTGLAISFRSNLTNIGAEGQMITGAVAAVLTAFAVQSLPSVMAITLCLLAGFLGGGFYGALAGFLKARKGTSEIISTIMLNYIAISFLGYLLDGPMKEPGGYFPQTALMPAATVFPRLIPGTRLHIGILLAVVLLVGYYILIFRLPLGYRIRAVGLNPNAARYAGIRVERHVVIAMLLSGGLAGLAGMSEVFGLHGRLYNGFSAGYGFDAVAIALLGRLHPLGVPLAALFFGALRVGANAMQNAVQIPVAVVFVIQGVSVLFILTDVLLREKVLDFLKSRKNRGGIPSGMEVE